MESIISLVIILISNKYFLGSCFQTLSEYDAAVATDVSCEHALFQIKGNEINNSIYLTETGIHGNIELGLWKR